MSHKYQRSKKRLDRFEAEFQRLRSQPITGLHSVAVVQEQIIRLFREIKASPEELLPFVERVMGPKPEGPAATEDWHQVMVIAQQIVEPSLAAMTPGSVRSRPNRIPPKKAK